MGGQWWKRCLLCSGTILALLMSNWLMCVFAYARDLFPMQFLSLLALKQYCKIVVDWAVA